MIPSHQEARKDIRAAMKRGPASGDGVVRAATVSSELLLETLRACRSWGELFEVGWANAGEGAGDARYMVTLLLLVVAATAFGVFAIVVCVIRLLRGADRHAGVCCSLLLYRVSVSWVSASLSCSPSLSLFFSFSPSS